jgi:hypothetical protein
MKGKVIQYSHYHVTTSLVWQARATELRSFSKDRAGLNVYNQNICQIISPVFLYSLKSS